MKKISVIGSCVSREMFTTINNPRYKDLYVINRNVWQISIVSLMSSEFSFFPIDEDTPGLKKNYFDWERKKVFLDWLVEDRPDYIYFDLYADVRYGYLVDGESAITNNPGSTRKSDLYRKIIESKNTLEIQSVHSSSKKALHLELFKDAFSKFVEWKNKYLPDTKIIFNKFRYAFFYSDSHGSVAQFDLKRFNYLMNDLKQYYVIEEFISTFPEVIVHDNSELVPMADGQAKFGVTPWHFSKQYFKESLGLFNEIILKDILNS